jgi:hypothetical protein
MEFLYTFAFLNATHYKKVVIVKDYISNIVESVNLYKCKSL